MRLSDIHRFAGPGLAETFSMAPQPSGASCSVLQVSLVAAAMSGHWVIWCPVSDCKRHGCRLTKAASEEEVRGRLAQHLWAAPAHQNLSEQERDDLVKEANMEWWPNDKADDGEHEGEEERAAKREHEGEEARAAKRQRRYDGLAKAVAEGVGMALTQVQQQQQQQVQHQPQAQFQLQPATTTSSSSSDAVAMPRSTVIDILEHLNRGEKAAREAHLIATKAGLAFEAQANAIAHAKAMVEAMLFRR